MGGTFIGNAFLGMFWEIPDQIIIPAPIQAGSAGSMRANNASRALQPRTRLTVPLQRVIK